jgi:hypothetical protein
MQAKRRRTKISSKTMSDWVVGGGKGTIAVPNSPRGKRGITVGRVVVEVEKEAVTSAGVRDDCATGVEVDDMREERVVVGTGVKDDCATQVVIGDMDDFVGAEVADDCATGVVDRHAAGTKASSHKYLPDTPSSAQLW